MTVAVEKLLGDPEAEHVHVELRGVADLLGRDEHVVHPRRRDPVPRGDLAVDRLRVDVVAGPGGADLLDVVHELHDVAARSGEADRLPLPEVLAAAEALDREAEARHPVLEVGEVVLVVDLERHEVHADPRCVAQPQRVVVFLVPALEVDRVLVACGDLHAHDLGVVRRGQGEVRDGDVDVAETQDAAGRAGHGAAACLSAVRGVETAAVGRGAACRTRVVPSGVPSARSTSGVTPFTSVMSGT